jgi:hypothetical protein
MPKQVVEISWRAGFAAKKGCYHSYLPKSHERWIAKIDQREGKRAWNEAKKERRRQQIEEERKEIETARRVREQRAREWEKEKKLRDEIIRDIIHGRRRIDRTTHEIARNTNHWAFEFLSRLMEETEKKYEWGTLPWWVREFLEQYEYWDFDHPPRKRKWWR